MRRLAVLAVAFLSCTRAEAPPPFRLRIAAVGPLAPLSPDVVSGYSTVVLGLVFEPLAQPGSDGGWRSQVTSGWERLDPGRFRFRLSAGVTFSDGSAPGREDIVTALADGATVEEDAGWVTARWKEQGENPEGQLLSSALWRRSARGPIGTGPFVVSEQDSSHILLRRRTASPGRVAEVELVSYPSQRDAFAAALRGEMNMMLMPDDGQLELLSGVGHLRVVRAPGVQSVAAMFNTRQLVAEDRRQLVAALRLDGVVTVYGPLCRREPTKAPPAPVPAGAPLDLLVVNTPQGLLPTAFELRRALGSRGGAVTTVTIEDAQKRLTSGTFSLLIATWMTWPPDLAASAWFTGSPRNLTGYSNPRVDEALRNSDFTRAREALADDPPAAYLCRLDRTAVVDARLVDAKLGEHDLLDSVADWRVEP